MLCIGCKAPRRTSISPTQQKRAHPGLERGPFLYTVVLNTRPPLFSNLYLKGVIRGKKLYLVSRKTVVAFALRIQTTVPSVSRFLARLQRYGYICQIWRALKIALLSKQKNKRTSHQKKKKTKWSLIEIPSDWYAVKIFVESDYF